MIAPQSLLHNLELIANQVVEGFIIGLHKSPFHGFSVEFAEHRLYNQGDPLRYIDWRVFGRTEKLFIKRFEEETNLRCCIAVDVSSSMYFPEHGNSLNKIQFSSLAAASIMQLLKRQLDATSLVLFDDAIRYFSQTRSATRHYRLLTLELERQLNQPRPEGKRTSLNNTLHLIAEQMHKRSLVIVFSDMVDDTDDVEGLFAALQHLKYNKHEVILFHVMDGRHEMSFEFENRPYEFADLETGVRIRLQPEQVKAEYLRRMHMFQQEITLRCHRYGIERMLVDLTRPVEEVLYTFLLKRNKLL